MVDKKIARPRDERQKNKSPTEGTDEELIWLARSNSSDRWTDRES